ncbi:hypothetical protein B0H16DRAFT_1544667 [Mycena metata]|uniref:ORC1/DEAH AAA+ ATPase domain-containing protein n=1 Tax=Mycena metata TaxID=1033252 RepID=A0AAD7J0H1_9AGAR|nr:hypothetical protein B0H16DRAFT_1544667 [Mycena metata]
MPPMLSSLFPILSKAHTHAIQTSASRTFSLFFKSFGVVSDVDDPDLRTDSHIPKMPPYLAKEIRKEELAAVIKEISDPARSCIACIGGYGMGKTTIALLTMHDPSIEEAFHRRYWIDCHALADTSSFLQMLATRMGVPPTELNPAKSVTSLEAIVASIQHLRPPGRILLVLDDVDHLYFLDKLFADATINALANVNELVLLLAVNGWVHTPPLVIEWTLHLKPLSPQMAEYLFQSVYLVPRQRKELGKLLKLVGGVPQYIVVLANLAYERRLQPTDLLQIMEDPATNLLGVQVGGQRSLEASMRAYTPEDRLGHDPQALRVFHVLASLPGGVPRDSLQTYVGLTTETIDSICDQFSRLSFIQTEDPSRLMLMKPVRDYALRFSEFDDETRQVLLSQVVSLTEIPKSRLRPGTPEFPQTVQQFENDRANLENILFTFLDKNLPTAVEAALRYLTPLCAVRPSLKLATRAVEVAERVSGPFLLAQALQTLAEVQYNSGDFKADKVFARAEVLFRNSQDEASVIGALECRFFLSEIRHRGGLMHFQTDGLEYAEGFEEAVQFSSTLGSEAGKRCHALGLLKLGEFTRDRVRGRKLIEAAEVAFEDLKDDHGQTLCAFRLGKLPTIEAAKKFQDFGDLVMAASCYERVVPSQIEYSKVNGTREILLIRGVGSKIFLDLFRKAIDIYELLERHLDVAFCQYHLAQLLPPKEAVSLYTRAIYQFNLSRFTHHRERATLDMCYSLMEEGSYTEAVAYLEVLQDEIGYCGPLFAVRCKELLTECHCRLNAQRPALQAVRATLEAIRQLSSDHLAEIEILTPNYTNLLAALDGPSNIAPTIAFETHAKQRSRFSEVAGETNTERKGRYIGCGACPTCLGFSE